MSNALTQGADSTELVIATATPLPVFSGEQMALALTAYRELQGTLDRSMPDQIMNLDGKAYRKKGYWRAISVAFNVTVEPISETRDIFDQLEDGSDNYTYRVSYRATTASGRTVIGDGACSAAEKARGRMRATEHNVRSHAHTRAFNRAISNLVGFGEVSAEEIELPPASGHAEDAGAPPPAASPAPRSHSGSSTISDAQGKRLYALAKHAGKSDDEIVDFLNRRGFRHSREIPRDQYDQLCRDIAR